MKGVSFNGVHSWRDLHLVLSAVDIPPAEPKLNFVEVPGRDGDIDISEANGEIRFNDRECEFTFTVMPEDDFEQKKTEVSNLLNGRRCKIAVDKDPDYNWTGRCSINEYASSKVINKIVVSAIVAPYKLKSTETRVTVKAGTKVQQALTNGRKSVVPAVTATAQTTIELDGKQIQFGIGTHTNLAFQLKEGTTTIKVTSTAPVTIVYQEGDL